MPETTQVRVVGKAWIGDGADEYWAQSDASWVEAAQSDENEIRLSIRIGDSETDDATVYLTEMEAYRLMASIGRALLT